MWKMRWLVAGVLIMLILAGLAACTNESGRNDDGADGIDDTTAAPQTTPIDITPEADEAVIVGRVYSTAGGGRTPLSDTQVWFATVFYNDEQTEGAYFIDGSASPSTTTGPDGTFVIRNLEAREYVIVVGDLYGQNVTILNPDGSATIWTPVAGQVLDVETLEVDLTTAPVITPLPVEPYPATVPGGSSGAGSAYP